YLSQPVGRLFRPHLRTEDFRAAPGLRRGQRGYSFRNTGYTQILRHQPPAAEVPPSKVRVDLVARIEVFNGLPFR
ncbi:MAG TPA: hypothetical protein VNB49_14125, partial [Candidatus Dormibacteraeota bacterium]|nr:hypothetical protein [Candidatus Dormibacteraeota bacterium]